MNREDYIRVFGCTPEEDEELRKVYEEKQKEILESGGTIPVWKIGDADFMDENEFKKSWEDWRIENVL